MSGCRLAAWMLLPLLAGALGAQEPAPPSAEEKARQEEQARLLEKAKEVVEANRKGAKPRPVASRGPLGAWEVERVKLFQKARKSVVFITNMARQVNVVTQAQRVVEAGLGSGFVWDELGHVVTNFHVVEDVFSRGDLLSVKLSDGKDYQAVVIGASPAYDTAVLQVFGPRKAMTPLPLGRSGDLQVGQSVVAIGNPYGLDHTLTSGVVSALNRDIDSVIGTDIPGAIQTDAAINPGNSGGPLLDSGGRVLGMNTSIAGRTGGSVGIGFAIPVDTLNRIVPVLIAKRELDFPYLGFRGADRAEGLAIGMPQGIPVVEVDPGGPAEKAGLRPWRLKRVDDRVTEVLEPGDTVIGFQGRPVLTQVQFLFMLDQATQGTPLTLDILREGRVEPITLIPGKPRQLAPPKAPKAEAQEPATPSKITV